MEKFLFTMLLTAGLFGSAYADDLAPGGIIREIGSFTAVPQAGFEHGVKGQVTIEELPDGLHLKLGSDFQTSSGPDLRIVLRDSTGKNQMIIVAPLKSTSGRQDFMLPISAEMLESFNQVVVYCAQFHVDFGIADLRLFN